MLRINMTLVLLNRLVSSLNIFIWGVTLCCHAACKNFAGLFAVRLVLGTCEGSVTTGFMIVSTMFYTRREHTARVGYWCRGGSATFHTLSHPLTVLMNGTGWKSKSLYRCRHSWALQLKLFLVSSALVPCTFILQDLSRGNGTTKFNISPIYLPFSRLMIITGIITLITALSFL
jgi:hypothetical protein